MKILFVLFFILVFSAQHIVAQKDTCQVGAFITDIYDINLSEKSFKVKLWVWGNYKNDSLKILENFEFPYSKSTELSLATIEKRGEINYAVQKCTAEMKKDWDITNFPLDNQIFEIEIESGDQDTSTLIFIADTKNSKIDSLVKVEGWQIKNFKIKEKIRHYNTNYGDPAISDGTGNAFASTVIQIQMEREGLGLFFKIFTGLYVAFSISCLVFFMGPENAERFGLLVGALFAAIGNKYIVDSVLPETTSYTLVDKIHVVTFIYILLNLILTVLAYRLYSSGREDLGKKVDWIMFWVIICSYMALNLWFIFQATSNVSV